MMEMRKRLKEWATYEIVDRKERHVWYRFHGRKPASTCLAMPRERHIFEIRADATVHRGTIDCRSSRSLRVDRRVVDVEHVNEN